MAELVRIRKKKLQIPISRLRSMLKQIEEKDVDYEELKKNLDFTASLLEAVYLDGTRQCLESEDDLQQLQSDGVPLEVTDWLASTFTQRIRRPLRRSDEKPKFRSIVHAVQAGIFVERMFKRAYTATMPDQPAAVINCLRDVDRWSFDVFALNSASSDHALQTLFFELIIRYDLNSRFKIPISCLTEFLSALERGYCKYNNPYHNLVHAADVTQTMHCLLLRSGLVHWLTQLEVMASLFAAAIHDFEHTGTTNNFHIHTRSVTARMSDSAEEEVGCDSLNIVCTSSNVLPSACRSVFSFVLKSSSGLGVSNAVINGHADEPSDTITSFGTCSATIFSLH